MKQLLNDLKIEYNDIEIYSSALTHPSYTHEKKKTSYQRLEFLGDAVFDLIISEYFYNNYNYTEGEMTKLRSMYVCEQALYFYAKRLSLHNYILLGKGERGCVKEAIVADAFEAFIAAIYLDKGYSDVINFFNEHIVPIIENNVFSIKDYKSTLQELVQSDKRSLIYKVVKQEGPSHDPTFYVDVYMDNILLGSGVGHSKKLAEQDAAKHALDIMVSGG